MADGHPAWQEILDQIPEEYHALVKPKLAEWDKGVQDRFQELRDEYKPYESYKQFVEHNIDPKYLVNAYNLAQNFENSPEDVVQEAIKVYGLDFAPKGSGEEPPGGVEHFDPNELDPAMKTLMDQVQQMQQQLQERFSSDEEEENIRQFQEYLDGLKETHGEFDTDYVTALISQGVDGEEAVSRYKAIVGGELEQQVLGDKKDEEVPPPVVVGGGGSSGSGLEQQPIDFAKASNNEVDDVVQQMLEKANANNQG